VVVKDFGFYGQEELLMLDERLTLTGAIRGEQSSANGDDEELFWYPKASASYRFPEVSDVFDEIKLRIAYGESGNQPLFGQKFVSLNATQNIAGNPGLTVNSQVGDPNIKPERTKEIEFGVDMNLFDGNAVLDATFYQQNITDLLLERQIAPSSGFESQFFNGGELRVRGFELAFGVTPIRTNDVLWVSRTLFSTDSAEIIDLPVPDFVLNAVFGAGLGDFQIAEGEDPTKWVGLVDGELEIVGDTNPDFKMSFSNDVSWGDWNFYTLFDWAPGVDVLNLTKFLSDLGQTTNDFEANGADRLAATSPVYIEDAGFVKLRELRVSYEMPIDWVQTWWPWAQRARLSFSGRDLLTFTDYDGLDPEVSNFGNQPIARNVDTSPYPPSRSYWFSVDLGF
jgi:outer membrane receptor protein involved in Fe transport